DRFLKHEGIRSWFSSLEPWHDDFVLKERLFWLEIEGVPIRDNDTFKSICRKWGEVLFIDDADSSNRFSIRLCIKSPHTSLIFASTVVMLKGITYAYRVRVYWTPTFAPEVVDKEDEGPVEHSSNAESDNDKEEEESVDDQPIDSNPFRLESLIVKNGNYQTNKQGSLTSKYPPGFTQSDGGGNKHDFSDVCKPVVQEDNGETSMYYESKSMQSSQVKDDEVPRKYVGVSIIQQVEDMIKVGIALGFNMEGCQHMLEKRLRIWEMK
ncbi:hypothetical protein Tco_1522061, partial [Tanacetum coccineum]